MKITVHAKPAAHEEKIEKIGENEYRVSVKEPPVQGKANAAIIKALAVFFNVPASALKIVSGWTSRKKIIEIVL